VQCSNATDVVSDRCSRDESVRQISDVVGDCGDGGIEELTGVIVTELYVEMCLAQVVAVRSGPERVGGELLLSGAEELPGRERCNG
jgi:hypothetical protein